MLQRKIKMSNESSQIKYPFRCIKPKNKDTKAILSNKRSQAVKHTIKDKENYCNNDCRHVLKSCDCIILLNDRNKMPKICE